MKKLIVLTLAIVFCFALTAQAATVQWEHDGLNTVGYTIYFWETAVPGTVYNTSVVGNTVRQLEIDDVYFKGNVEYTFMGKAWNNTQTSDPSNTAVWTRDVPVYVPPEDKLPAEVHIYKPNAVILHFGD